MKFPIALVVLICVVLGTVSAAPQPGFNSDSQPVGRQNFPEISPPDSQQPINFRPGGVLNQFAEAVGEVINGPAVLVALAFYPIACAIREGGCRSGTNFDGMIHFNLSPLNGDIETLKEQVKDDGDVDVTNYIEYKPLHDAFENANAKVVKIFLQNDRNVESETIEDKEKTLKILLKAGDEEKTNEILR